MTVKTEAYQIGLSGTPSQNFHWTTPVDGRLQLFRGPVGAPIGAVILEVDAAGNVSIPKALPAAFSAHNNGVAQSIADSTFVQLNMSTEVFDQGGFFAGNVWTPPAGRPILLTAQVKMQMPASGNVLVAGIYKNGALFKQGSQTYSSGGFQNLSCVASCIDIPNGTDVYAARVFQTSGGANNTLGAQDVTWFQGAQL